MHARRLMLVTLTAASFAAGAARAAAGLAVRAVLEHPWGESVSSAAAGDLDGYALERRVRIPLSRWNDA